MSNDANKGKFFMKVMSTQIPTSLRVSFTITSTTTTSKLVTKRILIGKSVGGAGSRSKLPP